LLTGNIYRGVVPLKGVSGRTKSWMKLPGIKLIEFKGGAIKWK